MYTKDKHNRITLRLNDDQFSFVKSQADQLGVSPSDFLRMVVNASMFSFNALKGSQSVEDLKPTLTEGAAKFAVDEYKKDQEGVGRENDKADQYDLV